MTSKEYYAVDIATYHFNLAFVHLEESVRLAYEAKKLAIQSQGCADLAQEIARIYSGETDVSSVSQEKMFPL